MCLPRHRRYTAAALLQELNKELRAADERANRALADAARALEQLHEEQEHSMKIDALRKSLEEQVKQLQVQIQEAEAAALLGGKRVIAKLETRIRDVSARASPAPRASSPARARLSARDGARRGVASPQGDAKRAPQKGPAH